MTTLQPKLSKLQSFRLDDVKNPEQLRNMLNTLVEAVKSTQQVRYIFRSFQNISPTNATGNPWTLTISNPGFRVGGVLLAGFRIMNLPQVTPTNAWSIDWVVDQSGNVTINGQTTAAAQPGAYYTASFLLVEDS